DTGERANPGSSHEILRPAPWGSNLDAEYFRFAVGPEASTGLGERVLPVVVDQADGFDAQVASRVRGVAGPGEQEALRERAAHAAQDLELLPGLDALGDHLDVEAARHG